MSKSKIVVPDECKKVFFFKDCVTASNRVYNFLNKCSLNISSSFLWFSIPFPIVAEILDPSEIKKKCFFFYITILNSIESLKSTLK